MLIIYGHSEYCCYTVLCDLYSMTTFFMFCCLFLYYLILCIQLSVLDCLAIFFVLGYLFLIVLFCKLFCLFLIVY